MILSRLGRRVRLWAPLIAILNLRNAYLSMHVSLVAQEIVSTYWLPRTFMATGESFWGYYSAFGLVISWQRLLYYLLMICLQWVIFALSVRWLIIHVHLRARFNVPQDRGITLPHLILALASLHLVSHLIQLFILLLEPKVKVPTWKALLNDFKDLYNINFEF